VDADTHGIVTDTLFWSPYASGEWYANSSVICVEGKILAREAYFSLVVLVFWLLFISYCSIALHARILVYNGYVLFWFCSLFVDY